MIAKERPTRIIALDGELGFELPDELVAELSVAEGDHIDLGVDKHGTFLIRMDASQRPARGR